VLLDVGDGEIEDLDAIARLAAAQPGLPIVALTGEPGALTQALAFGAERGHPGGAFLLAASLVALALLLVWFGVVRRLRRSAPAPA